MRKLSRMRKDKTFKESFTNSLPVFLLVHQLLADYRFVPPSLGTLQEYCPVYRYSRVVSLEELYQRWNGTVPFSVQSYCSAILYGKSDQVLT